MVLVASRSFVKATSFTDLGCVFNDNARFFYAQDSLFTWEEANQACTDAGMTLARVDTVESLEFLRDNVVHGWLGIVDPNPSTISKPLDTSRFTFVDGVLDKVDFIQGEPEVEPWNPGEPNDSSWHPGGSAMDCVALITNGNSVGLSTLYCTGKIAFVCRKPCFVDLGCVALDNARYIQVNREVTLNEGIDACQNLGMSLARIDTKSSFEYICSKRMLPDWLE